MELLLIIIIILCAANVFIGTRANVYSSDNKELCRETKANIEGVILRQINNVYNRLDSTHNILCAIEDKTDTLLKSSKDYEDLIKCKKEAPEGSDLANYILFYKNTINDFKHKVSLNEHLLDSYLNMKMSLPEDCELRKYIIDIAKEVKTYKDSRNENKKLKKDLERLKHENINLSQKLVAREIDLLNIQSKDKK